MHANQRVGFLGESYAVVRTEPESQLAFRRSRLYFQLSSEARPSRPSAPSERCKIGRTASMIAALPSHFFLLVAAFLMRGAAVLASVSDSNPSTAENLRPTAWAKKKVMLMPAA